jgi:hypothetical protein
MAEQQTGRSVDGLEIAAGLEEESGMFCEVPKQNPFPSHLRMVLAVVPREGARVEIIGSEFWTEQLHDDVEPADQVVEARLQMLVWYFCFQLPVEIGYLVPALGRMPGRTLDGAAERDHGSWGTELKWWKRWSTLAGVMGCLNSQSHRSRCRVAPSPGRRARTPDSRPG